MPDRRDGRRARRLALPGAVLAAIAVLALAPRGAFGGPAAPADAAGIEHGAPAPGESCPDTTPAPGSSVEFCDDIVEPGGAAGSLELGALLPILLGALVGGGLVALAVAYVVMRRRASVPFVPAEPAGEWWVCRTCGKRNVAGSPRCFACGTWEG